MKIIILLMKTGHSIGRIFKSFFKSHIHLLRIVIFKSPKVVFHCGNSFFIFLMAPFWNPWHIHHSNRIPMCKFFTVIIVFILHFPSTVWLNILFFIQQSFQYFYFVDWYLQEQYQLLLFNLFLTVFIALGSDQWLFFFQYNGPFTEYSVFSGSGGLLLMLIVFSLTFKVQKVLILLLSLKAYVKPI